MGSQKQLNNYLREVKDKPFCWGEHDCFTFTNGAFRAMYGEGYAEDWMGRYAKSNRPLLPSQLRKEFGYETFDQAIADRLQEINYVPPKGALVATKKVNRWAIGYGLGISLGLKCAFLSEFGVVYIPVEEIDKAWVRIDENSI